VSRYQFPWPLLLRIALAVVRARPRSLGADAAGGLRGASPPPLALYTHYLPASGPFIVVGNHYERPGLWAGWGAMVVSAAVRETGSGRRELHWLMTDELLAFQLGPLSISRERIRAVFARFARVYGFGLVSAREAGIVGGASGLRVAARYLAAGEPVGVLPEGTASVALCEARPGVGTFLAWLSRDGAPLVPVGIAEPEGVLTATFGPPFSLPRVSGDKADRDRALRDAVMGHIARLLPPELRGFYREHLTPPTPLP
jgi:hypothetical protein